MGHYNMKIERWFHIEDVPKVSESSEDSFSSSHKFATRSYEENLLSRLVDSQVKPEICRLCSEKGIPSNMRKCKDCNLIAHKKCVLKELTGLQVREWRCRGCEKTFQILSEGQKRSREFIFSLEPYKKLKLGETPIKEKPKFKYNTFNTKKCFLCLKTKEILDECLVCTRPFHSSCIQKFTTKRICSKCQEKCTVSFI